MKKEKHNGNAMKHIPDHFWNFIEDGDFKKFCEAEYMSKKPKDAPEGKTGERIMMRGRPGYGVIAATLYRAGWVEVLWDDGSDNPMICHVNELIKR